MMNGDTQSKIKTLRDLLVGVLPVPTDQIKQITLALIYKFMSDQNRTLKDLGGGDFFAGEYAAYAWVNLMDPAVSAAERVKLYRDGLEKMSANAALPELFREIFRGAYLPFNNPSTLDMFLKQVNTIEYSHSEDLGDAYEALLAIMGAQGDAGQFRTPRHIIEFMVAAVDPQKGMRVLDPACGTAGFLVSAYRHILRSNTRPGSAELGSALAPDERTALTDDFCGYDISADMARLSRVNLYLHLFPDPKIYEYDTLTSLERWSEVYDCVLTNPPFMSPKGGIQPHNRFSIQSKRSEVLFVDYILEHLTPDGRAGIIVPEGIIFQSQNAHKALRRKLVEENYLYAVVSLPAGVFQPYSGVKTSILLIDRAMARKSKDILFVKVENDGFDLGAQRNLIEKNDLPEAVKTIIDFKDGIFIENNLVTKVNKLEFGKDGEFNLSANRYTSTIIRENLRYPFVELSDVCEIISGQSPDSKFYNESGQGFPFYQGKTEFTERFLGKPTKWTTQITRISKKNDLLMSVRAPVGPVNINNIENICIGRGLAAIRPNDSELQYEFLFYLLRSIEADIKGNKGSTFDSINRNDIAKINIPLPPLEIQREIVAEIEGYQKIIDGARMVVENWKPRIKVDPEWPKYKFINAPVEIIDGDRGENYPKRTDFSTEGFCLFLNTGNVRKDGFIFNEVQFIEENKDKNLRNGRLKRGDVILTTRGTVGNVGFYSPEIEYNNIRINSGMLILRTTKSVLLPEFLFYLLQSDIIKNQISDLVSGSAQPQLPIRIINNIEFSIPPKEKQERIINKIQDEKRAIKSNLDLIADYQFIIAEKLQEVWGF